MYFEAWIALCTSWTLAPDSAYVWNIDCTKKTHFHDYVIIRMIIMVELLRLLDWYFHRLCDFLIGAKLVYIFLVIFVIFVTNLYSNGYSLPPFYLLLCRYDGMKNMKKVGEKFARRDKKKEEFWSLVREQLWPAAKREAWLDGA
jgi:hypothetical protein